MGDDDGEDDGFGSSVTRGSGASSGSSGVGSSGSTAGSGGGTSSGGSSDGGSTGAACADPPTWWLDDDMDGFGDPAQPMTACELPTGFVDNDLDCDDGRGDLNPGVDETCDGIDNDCDLLVDEFSPQNATCSGCTLMGREDSVYWVCSTATNWFGARTDCMSKGAELVTIDDQVEHNFLVGAIPNVNHWIGLNDLATEGFYEWSGGAGASFTNWASGEPNDGGGDEDCVHIDAAKALQWNDNNCPDQFAYLCEG